jgi:hypothetical protein
LSDIGSLIPILIIQFTMKFTQSLVLFVTAAFTIPSVLADFHIVKLVSQGSGYSAVLEACPSNHYDCNCFDSGINGATAYVDGQTVGVLPSTGVFYVKSGLCGMDQLDFEEQSDGHWNIYAHNGPSKSVQGTCYSNTGSTTHCSSNDADEELVCFSYICS